MPSLFNVRSPSSLLQPLPAHDRPHDEFRPPEQQRLRHFPERTAVLARAETAIVSHNEVFPVFDLDRSEVPVLDRTIGIRLHPQLAVHVQLSAFALDRIA